MAKKNKVLNPVQIRKIFILDTSVILHDHQAVNQFEEHDVAIPISVLEELDSFKKGNDTINFEARQFIRFVDKLSELDTTGVEPLIFMSEEVNRLRNDDVEQSISHDDALRNAPKKDSDYFRIPKVLDK